MVAYTIKGNDLCSFPFTVSLILLSSAAFSSRVFMTVPIFPSDTAHRVAANRTHIQQLQSFDARCDWLSLIYRGPGSVNFKLTDKKSTATIRTHRFFSLSLSNGGARPSTQNGNNTAVGRVLVGGRRKRLVGSSFPAFFFL